MRILFVSQELPPETGWGGIGTYVSVLSQALAAKGAEVHVLSAVHEQPASRREVGGVTVHRCGLPPVHRPAAHAPEAWRRLLLAVSVARLVEKLELHPDVVESPEWMAEGLAIALRGTHPLVVRLHSSARQLFPFTGQGGRVRGLDGRLAMRLEEVAVRHANLVVSARSNLIESADRLRLDAQALHAISYPVRLPSPAPMPVDGSPRVAFLGRFERRKGPEVLLRAAPRVLAAVPDARFSFVGRDATAPGAICSAAWLRAEAQRLGIAHAVEVREAFGKGVVEEELAHTTVCAAPSRWESYGYVVAEAQALGRPVVVSPLAAFRDLVQDGVTGRIAQLDDPEAWAQALTELLEDRDRAAAVGRAAAAHVARISDPSRIAELSLVAYEDAIARWRRHEHAGVRPLPRIASPRRTRSSCGC